MLKTPIFANPFVVQWIEIHSEQFMMVIRSQFVEAIQQPIWKQRLRTTLLSMTVIVTIAGGSRLISRGSELRGGVESVYLNNCLMCHGETGRGDGPAAYLVFPKPRDFTSGVFRFKSTPGDQPPTSNDVVRTITQGIDRTAMPGFKGILDDNEILELADYVLSLNENSNKDKPTTPITIPPQPKFTSSFIAQGQKVYTAMKCSLCHGETGHGDGPSSWDLVDSDGYPLPPADYTTGVFKAGDRPEDLYRTIMVGVPGTPMPSFESAAGAGIEIKGVDPETDLAWALTAYIKSLAAPRERSGIASGAVIKPARLSRDAMVRDPFDRGWDQVESTPISVQPLWQRRWSTRAVELRIAEDRDRIAFCLEWPDESVDLHEGVDVASDAGAVMLSLSEEVPLLGMGGENDAGKAVPVNIWQWKACRQLDTETHTRNDIPITQAGAPADIYMFKQGDPVNGDLDENEKTYITAWDVGNLNADPATITNPFIESNAVGFGTLTQQPKNHQSVYGTGRWKSGKWRIVFVRNLKSQDDGDVRFNQYSRIPFALALWQGSALDRDGTKLVSGWRFLDTWTK